MSPQYNSCRPGAGAQSIVRGSTMYILHEHICAYLQIGAAAAVHVVRRAKTLFAATPVVMRVMYLRSQHILHVVFVLHSGGPRHLDLLLRLLLGLGFSKLYPKRHDAGRCSAGVTCNILCVSALSHSTPHWVLPAAANTARVLPPRFVCAKLSAVLGVLAGAESRPWVGTFHWISAPTLGHWGRGARGDILTGPGADEWWIFLSENIIPWWCQRNSQEILYKNNFCLNLEKLYNIITKNQLKREKIDFLEFWYTLKL